MKILFAISTLISLLILMLFVLSLIWWISGGGNVLFPGLGLIMAMGVIVTLLLIMLIVSFAITFSLHKLMLKNFAANSSTSI